MKLTKNQRDDLTACARGGTPKQTIHSLIKKGLLTMTQEVIQEPVRPPFGIRYRGQTRPRNITVYRLTPAGYEIYEALRRKEYEDRMDQEANRFAADLAAARSRTAL
jgi:hypothetical protein